MRRLRLARLAALSLIAVTTLARFGITSADAQTTASPRTWSTAAGVDFPTVYIFRGIVQEGDPKLTVTPHADVDVNLTSSGSVRAGAAIWNSFNTGTSGSGGPLDSAYYAAQFTGRVRFALARGLTVTPSFFANTSPNDGYDAIREIDVTIARTGGYSPYALIAFELSDSGQLDGGLKKGRYLELGVTPHAGWRRMTVSIPVRAGFSLGAYYELFGNDFAFTDHHFGFLEGGGHLTVPLGTRFGSWSVAGGADVYVFGDSTRAFNFGDRYRTVATAGITYSH